MDIIYTRDLDRLGPAYDPVNVQILEKGPAVLTLDLNPGETPKINGASLIAGAERAKDQSMAATIKNFSYATTGLAFQIQNNTAHKLISGFPEGRRMFVNIKAYINGVLYTRPILMITRRDIQGLVNSANSPVSQGEIY